MDRVGIGRQEIADHEIAFGDPGAFIEQPCRLVERLEVECDEFGAELDEARHGGAVSGLGGFVAEEDQLSRAGNAELHAARKCRHRAERPVARERIERIRRGHDVERCDRIIDR